ncbi:MAG TPA: hypothetical protein VMS17_02770 [Gemmataceae bacterium]|nr:hypothetical protein [Gemmataceae bacterium]
MENTTRDRTEERRGRDDFGNLVVPEPLTPTADKSAHVPGGATELAELARALQPPVGGRSSPIKTAARDKTSPAS